MVGAHTSLFQNNSAEWIYFHFLSYSQFLFLQQQKKNKNAVASGNSSDPISLFHTRGHNPLHSNKLWCLKKDWFLFLRPPTHGWIGHRPTSLPFPFSSDWFTGHDFNKAPFPSALQRQPTRNNFKFDISLRFNFVDKENNIKVTQMTIIPSCSLGGFWSCFIRIVQLRRVDLMLCYQSQLKTVLSWVSTTWFCNK